MPQASRSRSVRRWGLIAVAALLAGPAGAAGSPSAAPAGAAPDPAARKGVRCLVLCAPGYPGTTLQAQPTMDAFAAAVAAAAGWPAGSLRAEYHETVAGGVKRLAGRDAALALVTLPFLLKEGEGLGLRPLLQVVPASGEGEIWSLVAKKGSLSRPQALAGWEITGGPGYAPGFVRGPVLGGWGPLPGDVRITFAPAVLSALRRAASGQKVAVLVDGEEAAALRTLPFATDLEIVARSPRLPGSLLCAVDDRLKAEEIDALTRGLRRLHREPRAAEVLQTMRITRFGPLEAQALLAARRAYAAAGAAR